MGKPIEVSFNAKEEIFRRAEAVVENLPPSFKAPIPIETIAESGFGLEIVVLEGLRVMIGCPAYTSWSGKQIVVDRRLVTAEIGWYNFSLAHELGHLVLHSEIFAGSAHRTLAEYERFRACIPEPERTKMEKQAQLFAGALLAPARTITAVADECVKLVRDAGLELTANPELDWPYVWKGIADKLEVNEMTVKIRFDDLGLIYRYV